MTSSFYKLNDILVSGVQASLADKFGLSVTLLRFLFVLFTVSLPFIGVIIYLLLIRPAYKVEEEQETFDDTP